MIITIFLFSLISWFLILKLIPNFWKKISLFLIFFLFFLVFDYIGFIFLIYNDFETLTYPNLIFEKSYFYKSFYISTSVMWLLVLVYVILFKNKSISKPTKYIFNSDYRTLQRKNILLFSICFLVFLLYLSNVGFNNLPLVLVLNGGSITELAVARDNAGNLVENYHRYKLFFRDLLYVVCIVSFYLYFNTKTYLSKLVFFSSIIFLIFTSLMIGEKALIIDVILLIFIVGIFVTNNGFINYVKAFKFLLISAVLIVVNYSIFMPASNTSILIKGILERLFFGQIVGQTYYLEMFPKHHEFLNGLSLPNPGGIFDYDPVNVTVLVMDFSRYNLVGESLGITGTMPMFYWGELYANFDYIGIFIGSLIVAFIFFIVDGFLRPKVFKNVWLLAFYIFLIIHLKDLAVTGLFGFIIDFYLIFVFIFIMIFKTNFKLKIT